MGYYLIKEEQVGSFTRFRKEQVSIDTDSNKCMVFDPHLILKSPSGSFWKLKVDNQGVLETEEV